ncbi:hypothetical protein HAX54_012765 [Datura stramonium]|uniref:Response regulatory domain-containing protein n=1 Tax=Datura stramonium TaxID=4076 RepID=A0ABS8TM36_DATST|nr:hypothetical protein [Datura stramonium]
MPSTVMSMLSKGKEKIDMMIINVHSPDSLYFRLLEQAVSLDIVSLFVSDEHNNHLAKKALADGAYLYLKKPLDEEIVKNLWQFVLSEEIQREKARKGLEENDDPMNVDDIGNDNIIGDDKKIGDKNMLINTEEQTNNINEGDNNIISNKNYMSRRKRGRKSKKEINEGESQKSTNNKTFKRKDSIKWTVDLHSKFVEATQQLGEGSSTTTSDNNFENATINGLRDANTNFQQYIGEQNMSDPSNVVRTLDVSNINGSDSNEKENYEVYFNFNNMDYIPQNLESPSATLLNKHGCEQTQVYSDDQVYASQ